MVENEEPEFRAVIWATACHLKYAQYSPTNNNRRNNPRVTFSDGLMRIDLCCMTSVAHPMARALVRVDVEGEPPVRPSRVQSGPLEGTRFFEPQDLRPRAASASIALLPSTVSPPSR
jgi:hypothetical protein